MFVLVVSLVDVCLVVQPFNVCWWCHGLMFVLVVSLFDVCVGGIIV